MAEARSVGLGGCRCHGSSWCGVTGVTQEYDHYDDPNNGDMQIIVPNKLLLLKVSAARAGRRGGDRECRDLSMTCPREVCGWTTTTSGW
eukprot:764024-Hanusia_phi.AAC.4